MLRTQVMFCMVNANDNAKVRSGNCGKLTESSISKIWFMKPFKSCGCERFFSKLKLFVS